MGTRKYTASKLAPKQNADLRDSGDKKRRAKFVTVGVAECRRGIGGGTSLPVGGGSGSREVRAGRPML